MNPRIDAARVTAGRHDVPQQDDRPGARARVAHGWKPAKAQRKNEHQRDTRHKRREGDREQRGAHDPQIDDGVPAHGRDHAQGYPEHYNEAEGDGHEDQRRGEPLRDERAHRHARPVRMAKIRHDDPRQPPQVLHGQRPIETKLLAQGRTRGGVHAFRPVHHVDRIAGDEADEQKRRDGHEQQRGGNRDHPPDDVRHHA